MFALRTLLALIVISAFLGVVAFAATHPGGGGAASIAGARPASKQAPGDKYRRTRPAVPQFIEVPAPPSIGTGAQFRFHVAPSAQGPRRSSPARDPDPQRPRRFQCGLDGGDWRTCASPYRLEGMTPGGHELAVRALSPAGRPGRAAHFAWDQLEAKDFSVEPQADALEDLYPGDPPQPLPVRIANPNPVPILVTSLTVEVGAAPPGCPAEPNFAPRPSNLSPGAPLIVPAEASVSLPSAAASAPAIALRDLPANQDACQGTQVPLVFSGEAHG